MKKIFKFISILLMMVMLLPNSTFAQNISNSIESISIKKLDTLSIEQTYSYEEILSAMRNNGCKNQDIKDFKKTHQNNLNLKKTQGKNETVRYSVFSMDGVEFTGSYHRKYRLQPEILAGLLYSGSPTPDRIVSLESPYVYTGNGSPSSFQGRMVYKLISGREFFTLIQGTAYKAGSMNVEGGIKVKLGENSEAYIKVSNGDGFLKDISHQETYYSPVLDK